MLQIITRDQARALGLKRYFTGKPCKNGHVAERHTSTSACVQCGIEWRARNAEARRKTTSEWSAENRLHVAEYKRNYRAKNIESERAKDSIRAKKRYANNKQTELLRGREKYIRTRSKVLERTAKYASNNPHVVRKKSLAYKSRKRLALPCWAGEFDEFVWSEAAHVALARELATGFSWQVDHMIPIAGETASGLHVWNNCQVIPDTWNMSKQNRMELTEPLEWLQRL